MSLADEGFEIIPSILSADFGRLVDQVQEATLSGIRTVQIDVMDGRFVPNITVGIPVVEALRRGTDARLDVHLMVVEPERFFEAFAAAGADVMTFHIETTPHAHRALDQVRKLGVEVGIALNPATPLCAIEELLPDVDLALVMTVNPGFGGQAFIPRMLNKVARLRNALDEHNPAARVQVDGGISADTAGAAVRAGAYDLVAGSAVFGQDSIRDAVDRLASAARDGAGGSPDST